MNGGNSFKVPDLSFSAAYAAVNLSKPPNSPLPSFSAAYAAVNKRIEDANDMLNFSAAYAAVNLIRD